MLLVFGVKIPSMPMCPSGLCSYGYLKHEAQLVEHWIPNRKVVGPIVGRPTGLKRPRMPFGLSMLESQSSEPLQIKFD